MKKREIVAFAGRNGQKCDVAVTVAQVGARMNGAPMHAPAPSACPWKSFKEAGANEKEEDRRGLHSVLRIPIGIIGKVTTLFKSMA